MCTGGAVTYFRIVHKPGGDISKTYLNQYTAGRLLDMKVNYLCNSWQFLLQQLVYQIGKGYYFYHVGVIPDNKFDKRFQIDQKIVKKYNIDLSKYQRARRKRNDIVNFYYLRWKNVFIILHTKGDFPEGFKPDDEFKDIMQKKEKLNRLVVRISTNVAFEITMKNKKGESKRAVTVSFSRDTMQNFNAELEELVKYKKLSQIKEFFARINNIPAWSGIIQQKQVLLGNLYKCAKKYKLNTKDKTFIQHKEYFENKGVEYPFNITTTRRIYNSAYINQDAEKWL